MSGDTTLQSLKRLSYIPDRLPGYDGGTVIAGQEYNDVEFIGGAISNVTLTDVTINGTETARNLRNVTAAGSVTVQSDDYVIVIDKTVPEITTVTLPASPTAKRSLIIKDGQGQAGDFNITINGNGKTIDDQSSFTIAADWGAVEMEFNSAEDQWNVLNSYKEVSSGDVVGPVSATDNAIARFDGATGRVIQNSAVTIADTTGVISGTQGVVFSGSSSGTTTLQPAAAASGTLTLPATTGTLAISAGASIPTIAQGDILYGSAANTLSALAKNTSATRYLSNTGTSNNPAWAQVDLTNGVTGVLPVANGGTNASSAGITAFNNITGYTAAGATGTTSTNLVFSTSPTLVTPTLGVASATSINKVTITTPATGSTLTIADGKTLTCNNTLTFTGTDSSSVAFGAGGTVVYTGSTPTFSGAVTAPAFIPSGSTVPTNGLYLPAANTLGWAINSAEEVQLTASAFSPAVNDGNALGTSSLSWADLFLASGAVINFNNGDVTLTHATGKLTNSGYFEATGFKTAGTPVLSSFGDASVAAPGVLFLGSDGGYAEFRYGAGWTGRVRGGNASFQFQTYTGSAWADGITIGTGQAVRFPGISTTASAANAYLNNADSNNLLRSTSSRFYKTDIKNLTDDEADKVFQLMPITYKSKAEADDKSRRWLGLIAEDVAEVSPELVNYTINDDPERGEIGVKIPDGVQYERLTVMLISIVKRQQHRIESLEAKIK